MARLTCPKAVARRPPERSLDSPRRGRRRGRPGAGAFCRLAAGFGPAGRGGRDGDGHGTSRSSPELPSRGASRLERRAVGSPAFSRGPRPVGACRRLARDDGRPSALLRTRPDGDPPFVCGRGAAGRPVPARARLEADLRSAPSPFTPPDRSAAPLVGSPRRRARSVPPFGPPSGAFDPAGRSPESPGPLGGVRRGGRPAFAGGLVGVADRLGDVERRPVEPPFDVRSAAPLDVPLDARSAAPLDPPLDVPLDAPVSPLPTSAASAAPSPALPAPFVASSASGRTRREGT